MLRNWICLCFVMLSALVSSQAFAICGDGAVEMGEQCDDGRRDDGDGCSSTCQIESPEGCADGQREGFLDASLNPLIAGCNGGWSVPGARSIEACGRGAGDDSANPTGLGCSAVDLCAVGWHVCGSVQDVSNSLGATSCNNAAAPNTSAYFASQISGPGTALCSNNPADTNDNFGCGNVGGSANVASCSPVTRFSNNLCADLPVTDGWTCAGANGVTEQTRIRKTLPQNGGVMCCFGPTYQVSISDPGAFTNAPRPTISGTSDAPDGTTISVVLPDQRVLTAAVMGGQWSVAWPAAAAPLLEGVASTIEATAYDPLTGFAGTRSQTTYVQCGSNMIGPGEQCDDGNLIDGDGCSSTCQLERCGNGLVQFGESCDDGNTDSLDGCSSMCQTEPGYTCPLEGGSCLTVSISAPSNNAILNAEPSYQGGATPGARVVVTWTDANGALIATAIVTANAAGQWLAVPQGLAEGTYTLTATVTTTGGSVSDDVTFTIDSTMPSLSLSTPSSGQVTSDDTPRISGSTEPGAVVTLEIVDSNLNVVQTLTPMVDAQGDFFIDPASLPDGDYQINATAEDAAGNLATTSTTFTVDTMPPMVTLATPADGDVLSDNTPDLNGATDANGVVVVIRDSNGMIVQTLATNILAGVWDTRALMLNDGLYNVEVTATDMAGNSTTINSSFTIDTMAPTLALTAPAAGSATQDTTPTISGTTEPGAMVSVTLTDSNGATVQTLSATANAAGVFTVDAMTLAEGDYTVSATTADAAGNMASAGPNSFSVDTTAPALTFDAPTNGEVFGVRMVVASGTGEVGASVEVELKDMAGAVVATQTAVVDANGAWSVTFMGLANGTYDAQATSADAAGNEATASTQFSVDSDEPNLMVTAPAQDEVTNDDTPTLTGTADNDATVTIIIRDAAGNDVQTLSAPVDANGDWTIDATTLPEGDYTASVTATRPNGKSTTVDVDFSVDTTAPTLSLLTPAQDLVTSMSMLTATGKAEPGQEVTITVLDAQGQPAFTGTATADANGDWSLPLSSLADGAYTVEATTADAAGNSTTAGPNSFTIDTTPPTVTVTSPAAGASLQDTTPTITGSAEPGATVEILVDGVKVGEAVADANGDWSLELTDALAPGDHTIEATSTDGAGNQGSSGQIDFTVTNPKAPVVITSPTDGGSVTGPSVTISGTGEPGDTITVTTGDKTETTTVAQDGTWMVTFDDLPEGDASITAQGDGSSATVNVKVTAPDAQAFLLAGGGCAQAPGSPAPLAWLLGLLGLGAWRMRRRLI